MITIRKVEPSDMKNVIDLLLTDFFPDEPCAAGLDLCPPGYRIPALEQDFRNIMARGWSFLAEDMEKVVGVVICDVENKNEVREEPVGIFPEKFMKLERFFGDMKSNIDLFEERDTILDIFIVCSRSSHRGQGIAGQLVRAAVDFARSEGVVQAYSMGLSNFSQRIFRKMGFEERGSIEFKDYTQDGESVFDLGKMGEHTAGVLFKANIAS